MRRMWTRAGALCVLALGISGLTAGGAAAQGRRTSRSGCSHPASRTRGR